jgi:hypothetical protein
MTMATDYDYDQLFPGRFLKAGLFKGKPYTLTIADVRLEEMPDKKRKKDVPKAILAFRETDLELVLNKTNGECLKGMFGRKVAAWVGQRVTFFPDMVDAFGRKKLAIRIMGSPDLASDMDVILELGQEMGRATMKKTPGPKGKGGKPAASKPAAMPVPPEPDANTIPPGDDSEPPPHDLETGEVADGIPFGGK